MVILIGIISLILIVGIAFVSHLAWDGFHRAVGIKRGKMKYIPPEQAYLIDSKAFKPQLIQINLSHEQMVHLPLYTKQQIQRIDDKADTYQEWRAELEKKNSNQHIDTPLHTSENQFVLSKLMSQHLPDIVSTYHNICNRKQRANMDCSSFDSDSQNQALVMLIELLDEIEQRLDDLLNECEQIQLQDLKVMKRYLNARD